jgi:hypothetical protein
VRPSILVLLVIAGGCYVPVYQVQRNARVPHAAVPLRTAQPLAGPVELTLGASNAGDLMEPSQGNRQSADEVPARQARGELRVRLGQRGELALVHEHGFGSSSQRLDPTQAPVGGGDVFGTGVAGRYAIELAPGWSLGLDTEVLVWTVPYVEYRTCVENCPAGPTTTIEHGTSNATTLGFGVTPSHKEGRATLFGGLFARNHPTITRKATEYYDTHSDDVENGPANVLVHAGLAYELGGGISALVLVHQNVSHDPVIYGPGVGVALSASLR